jgi:hypothetical protein
MKQIHCCSQHHYIILANIITNYFVLIFSGSAAQRGLWLSRITRFRDHTQRLATVGRTPQDE